MCVHFFQLWSFENYTSKFRPHLRHKISCSFSPSPSTHLLLPSSSYQWLPMVVSLFLTHLLLEVASPITFPPSPFHYHWSSWSKGLHWWRRSKAYKLNIKLHQYMPANFADLVFAGERIAVGLRKGKFNYGMWFHRDLFYFGFPFSLRALFPSRVMHHRW